MACDIRLQLEINIIWEANNRPHAQHQDEDGTNRVAGSQRGSRREDMRQAALLAAGLYRQQRRRLIEEIRSQQNRQRELARRRLQSSDIPPVAPLALEEDIDLEGSQNGDTSESDTLTCSRRSTTSEAGRFGSDEIDTEDAEGNEPVRKKKKKRRSRPSSREPIDNDEDEDDDEDEDTSSEENPDDEDDDDDDNDFSGNAGSSHPGPSYRDDYSDDDDSDDVGNSNDESHEYTSPLVVEVEIRHRSLFSRNADQMQTLITRIPLPFSTPVDKCKCLRKKSFATNILPSTNSLKWHAWEQNYLLSMLWPLHFV